MAGGAEGLRGQGPEQLDGGAVEAELSGGAHRGEREREGEEAPGERDAEADGRLGRHQQRAQQQEHRLGDRRQHQRGAQADQRVHHVEEALLLVRQRRDGGGPHKRRAQRQQQRRLAGRLCADAEPAAGEPVQQQEHGERHREQEDDVEVEEAIAQVEGGGLHPVQRALPAADHVVLDEVPQGDRPGAVEQAVYQHQRRQRGQQPAQRGRQGAREAGAQQHRQRVGQHRHGGHRPAPHYAHYRRQDGAQPVFLQDGSGGVRDSVHAEGGGQ
mmetsp:Transcript_45110/g.115381  ORF Transcript_45110/g.115381 Transcript_45110/m.115381 type:complete len:271 (-) Transcript_45110:829-1641(-)